MLENLISTKLKKRLLAVFYSFPQRSFSLRELRAYTGGAAGVVNQSLREFVSHNVLTTTSRRKKLFFRINPRFSLHDELRDLATDFAGYKEDFVSKKLKNLTGAKLIVLSGVFTHEPQLPCDLLVVGENINRSRLARIVAEVEKLVGVEVNYTIMDRAEYNYRRNVSDRFIRDILDYPHIMVVDNLRTRR